MAIFFWSPVDLYSLFFDPGYNPTVGGSDVTVDGVTYLLFTLEYFLNSILSVSLGCSMLSLGTILFALIEFILLLCWSASFGWPSTVEAAINKNENKQKSPPRHRELVNMIRLDNLLLFLLFFTFVDFNFYNFLITLSERVLSECKFRFLLIHYFAQNYDYLLH